MKLSLQEDVDSMSHFKANFSSIMKKVHRTNRPMVITQNGKSAGVFMDIGTWENYVRKMNLLRLVNEGEVSLKKDGTYSIEDTEAYFKKKYGL